MPLLAIMSHSLSDQYKKLFFLGAIKPISLYWPSFCLKGKAIRSFMLDNLKFCKDSLKIWIAVNEPIFWYRDAFETTYYENLFQIVDLFINISLWNTQNMERLHFLLLCPFRRGKKWLYLQSYQGEVVNTLKIQI